jgi:N-acetylglucosamine-6-sulfatase
MPRLLRLLPLLAACFLRAPAAERPNILFIFTDDHALNAISAYGSRLAEFAPTPNIDHLAREGALFRHSYCANSICGPSRATVLTGKHSHKNGFLRNDSGPFNGGQWTVAKELRAHGYQTAVIGKWHLISPPTGFDHWEILPGQGNYYNPDFIRMDGITARETGYATDLTTDKAIDWLETRDRTRPFFLMCQHKAPHRTFAPALRHLDAFKNVVLPEPETLFDDYANRSRTLAQNEMEIDRHLDWAYDLHLRKDERGDVQLPPPDRYGTPEYNRMNEDQRALWNAHFGPLNQAFLADFKAGKLSAREIVRWKYQRYLGNYLATVKAVDESVGRLLDWLDAHQLTEKTVVIYSSDQGFYLGEHGWYDKRWMFEESLAMPFLIRAPGVTPPGLRPQGMIQNIDYAPTFLALAGLPAPDSVQGRSFLPLLRGETPADWREAIYYAYYELGEHNVPQHFGVRTATHKLFHIPATGEWQLFDLVQDPLERVDQSANPAYAAVRQDLEARYHRLREQYEAPPYAATAPKPAAAGAP